MITRIRQDITHPQSSQVRPMDCSKSKYVLPRTFALRENDVLCGRGITCLEHTGNIRFRYIVSSYVPTYLKVTNKKEKTAILDSVAREVRAGGGEFLKYDTAMERYYEVGHLFARDKISQAFRDVIQDHYKSSSFAKKTSRKLLKPKMKDCIIHQNQSTFVSNSEDGSQKNEIHQDGYSFNLSPTQSSMIDNVGLELNRTNRSTSNQDLLRGMQNSLGELARLLYPSVSSDQLELLSTVGDRIEIRGTCHVHSQLHDSSDDSKRPFTYDGDKHNSAEEDNLVDKLVSNYPNTSNDELTFEKLLEIAMTLPTFNDNDTDNPRPI